MTDMDEQALIDYAAEKGARWKLQLDIDWQYASCRPGPLQYLRNASWFGPQGLAKYRLPKNKV